MVRLEDWGSQVISFLAQGRAQLAPSPGLDVAVVWPVPGLAPGLRGDLPGRRQGGLVEGACKVRVQPFSALGASAFLDWKLVKTEKPERTNC